MVFQFIFTIFVSTRFDYGYGYIMVNLLMKCTEFFNETLNNM